MSKQADAPATQCPATFIISLSSLFLNELRFDKRFSPLNLLLLLLQLPLPPRLPLPLLLQLLPKSTI